ncbi:MAG: 6,7-dimethyl-8-ribityllumazine synthase [Bacteroidetes bacterium]|nr:6,7-dimethyl-8-ribityllumazine synthase [Bacteroidota bacterium]
MASVQQNLSVFDKSQLPDATKMHFGIAVAEWNSVITGALYKGAYDTLISCGVSPDQIHKIDVPGSFELTAGAKFLASNYKLDAIICLGCVIQGETRHFDFICQAVANGLTNLSVMSGLPFIFGVLTTDTEEQAKERSGGKHGNKGIEAAITAIKMAGLKSQKTKSKIGFGG